MRKVLITGLGFATCLGLEAHLVEERLRELRHGIQRYAPFIEKDLPVKVAAPVEGFETSSEDPEDWIFPAGLRLRLDQLRGMAPHGTYATFALRQALAQANLPEEYLSHPRTGLFTASAGSPSRTFHNLERLHRLGPQRCSPLGIVASIAGTLNFNLVAMFKIRGSSAGFVSACASSGHALGFAHDEIALGRQDRMLVVGAEDFSFETIVPFSTMRVLSTSDDPDRASRPFDRARDGFVGTGGAVAMVLEAEECARARQVCGLAEFRSWGQSTDGHHVAISHPEGEGLARAMRLALDAGHCAPSEVDYLNAHATSTTIGDTAELRAIKSVFGSSGKGPAISSTKGLTGHALSLSSIMEAAFTTIALHKGFMPGNAGLEDPDPEAEGLDLIGPTRLTAPGIALSNSSGFGGANVSILLARTSS